MQSGRAQSLEKSILHNEAALKTFTQDEFPEQWASAKMNRGSAFVNRILGDRAENLETAISCYQCAFNIFEKKVFPAPESFIDSYFQTAFHDTGILGQLLYFIKLIFHPGCLSSPFQNFQGFTNRWRT